MLNAAEIHSSYPTSAKGEPPIREALSELYDIQATLDSLSQGSEPIRAVVIAWLAKKLEYVHDDLERHIPLSMRRSHGGAQ